MNDNDFKQIAHDILEDYSYAYSEADTGNLAEYLQSKFYEYRAEAIKEFAERLKENISNMEYTADVKRKTVPTETLFAQVNWVFHEIVPETIDKLVKEMTEVRHAETD